MNYFLWILLIVISFNKKNLCTDVPLLTRQSSEAVDNSHLGKIRNVISKDMNSFDRMGFDRVEFEYPGDMFSANMNMSKGSITGLSDCNVLEFVLSKNSSVFTFSVVCPLLKLYAEYYKFNGHIFYVVPMKGEGFAHFEFYKIQFKATFFLKDKPLTIEKIEDPYFKMERALSYTEFDLNIDQVISAIVEDLVAENVNRFSKYILITYSDGIIDYINSILY